jgi:uncharacterized protein (TIGR02147 family)
MIWFRYVKGLMAKRYRPTISEILTQDFKRRQTRNRAYSFRAHARFLNLPPSTLLSIMNGKSRGSPTVLKKISKKLQLSESECLYLLKTSTLDRTKSARRRQSLLHEARRLDTRFNLISNEDFQHLGFWHCFAVMELIKLKGSKLQPAWIAKKLNIPEYQIEASLKALVSQKIIEITPRRELKILKDFITLPSGERLDLARNFHGELIRKAQDALFNQSENQRNISSLVLRFRSSDLPRVDEFIRNFRRSFSATFEEGEGHDSVYSLGIQFFRLDKEEPGISSPLS